MTPKRLGASLATVVALITVPAVAAATHDRAETAGGVVHTWSDYHRAAGTAGPLIASHKTVLVACRVQGYKVEDGNRWWYRIASAPWRGRFYASADAFYNNGRKSGSLVHTPFFDPKVPVC